ncbi:TPA: hypothetical protein MAQ80_004697 [Klebsiella pneumoniae]|nr:hypothetical protein [Klebsiella pneumoniae]
MADESLPTKRISELERAEKLNDRDIVPVSLNNDQDPETFNTQGVPVLLLSDHILGKAFQSEDGDVAAAIRDENLFSIFEVEKSGGFGTGEVHVGDKHIENNAFIFGTDPESSDVVAAIRDENLFSIFEVEKSGGFGTSDVYVGAGHIENNAFLFTTNTEGRRIECDLQGFEFQQEESSTPDTPPTPTPPDNSLTERDNRNKLAATLRRSQELAHDVAGMLWDYCIVLVYGQSLGSGFEGWPALTKLAREIGNLLMVGDSVRGSSRSGIYAPLGDNVFKDLRSVVQGTANPAIVLTDQQISALAAGSSNEGEAVDVGAVHFWRALQLQMQGKTADPDRKIVVVNCSVAGRSVEQLSKGAATQHYENRVQKSLANIKSLVDAKSAEAGRPLTCGITATIYIGNEWNYVGTDGTTDKNQYKAKLGQLFDDITAENQAIFGTDKRPVFITTQTGDGYTRDNTNLSIGTAHIEMQNERDNVFCAGPNYPVPSKPSGHRDPNGYRWLGQKIGQVLHHTVDLRRQWFPMFATGATFTGKEALVDHMVMSWPAVWRETFSTITPTMYPYKGYRLVDALGTVPITSVEIAADTITRIIANRDLIAPVYVWYAGQTTYSGDGNLFDSDSTLSLYNYEYNEGSGQYAAANLPAYVGKPYPLNNACAAYRIEAIKND